MLLVIVCEIGCQGAKADVCFGLRSEHFKLRAFRGIQIRSRLRFIKIMSTPVRIISLAMIAKPLSFYSFLSVYVNDGAYCMLQKLLIS